MKLDVRLAVAGIVISILVFGILAPVLFFEAVTGLDRYLGLDPLISVSIAYILTAAALVVGLFWVFWAYSYLLFVGHGSPVEAFGIALHPTQRLVTVGPYAYTRNPMILGYLWILLGIALYGRSLSGIAAVILIAILTTAYLKTFEEPVLARRFGSEYQHYREHVPMLFPVWSVYIRPESAAEA